MHSSLNTKPEDLMDRDYPYKVSVYRQAVQHENPIKSFSRKKDAVAFARSLRNDFLAEMKPGFAGLFKYNDERLPLIPVYSSNGEDIHALFQVRHPGDNVPVFQAKVVKKNQ